MKINTKKYAIALYQVISESKNENIDKITKNFIELLAKKNLISYLPKILSDFIKYYNDTNGIIEVEMESAQEINSSENKNIIKELENITRKQVEFKSKVNKELIAGIILKINGLVIDGSIKKQLENLKTKILLSL